VRVAGNPRYLRHGFKIFIVKYSVEGNSVIIQDCRFFQTYNDFIMQQYGFTDDMLIYEGKTATIRKLMLTTT
jgi:hypothetical protein